MPGTPSYGAARHLLPCHGRREKCSAIRRPGWSDDSSDVPPLPRAGEGWGEGTGCRAMSGTPSSGALRHLLPWDGRRETSGIFAAFNPLSRLRERAGVRAEAVAWCLVRQAHSADRLLRRHRFDDAVEHVVERADDNPESVRKRLQVYDQQTAPVIEFYRQHGQLTVVDGVGSLDEVFTRIVEAIAPEKAVG